MSRTTPEISSIAHAFASIRALVAGAKANEHLSKSEALETIDKAAQLGGALAARERKAFDQLLDYAVEYEGMLRYGMRFGRADEVARTIAPFLLERLAPVPPAPNVDEAISNPPKFKADAEAYSAWLDRAKQLTAFSVQAPRSMAEQYAASPVGQFFADVGAVPGGPGVYQIGSTVEAARDSNMERGLAELAAREAQVVPPAIPAPGGLGHFMNNERLPDPAPDGPKYPECDERGLPPAAPPGIGDPMRGRRD